MKRYIVTEEVGVIAPKWLSERIDLKRVKILYRLIDGAEKVKGVKINDTIAEVGDTITFDGNELSVERR